MLARARFSARRDSSVWGCLMPLRCLLTRVAAVARSCWSRRSPPAGGLRRSRDQHGAVRGGASAGGRHTCALPESGVPKCWGEDIGTRLVPPRQLRAHHRWSCAECGLRSTGHVECWGTKKGSAPRTVTFTQIDAGDNHVCGVDVNNAIYCWGKVRVRPGQPSPITPLPPARSRRSPRVASTRVVCVRRAPSSVRVIRAPASRRRRRT